MDCYYFGLDIPMIEDTTKLYDKSFLCPKYNRIKKHTEHQIKTCKSKKVFKYRYDALKFAKERYEKTGQIQRPYQCSVCHKWHNTTWLGKSIYNPIQAFQEMEEQHKYYD